MNDWGGTSAKQTIKLVNYLKNNYNIDKNRVFAKGYFAGGETMSLVMGIQPFHLLDIYIVQQTLMELYIFIRCRKTYLLLIGENDEYYGSTTLINTYNQIISLYKQKGLDEDTLSRLITFNVKDSNYFTSKGVNNQHGGCGYLFCKDELIMN